MRIAIEARAPLEQLVDVADAVLDQHVDRGLDAQAIARGDGVGGVLLGRVAGADGGGNAALRVAGVAFGGIGLGEDEHVAGQREIGGGAKAGDAAADDQEIRAPRHRMLS